MENITFGRQLALSALLFGLATTSQALSQIPNDSLRITVSDGTELHVTVRGEGIPCLYIHGGPGVGSYWMEQLYGDVLERHFTMIYLDQRGSGRSASATSGDYSLERMTKDIEEVRELLGYNSWITFSHSFGGIIQIKHAQLYPDHIKAMLMIAPTLSLNESIRGMIDYSLKVLEIEEDERPLHLDETKSPFDRLIPLFGLMREKEIFWKYHYGDPANYAIMDSVMAEVKNPNYEFSNRSFTQAEYYINYKPLTPDIDVPVLLYFGRTDYAVGPNHYQGIYFPKMTLYLWDGGHVPFMEGKQELEHVITKWLAKI